MKTTLVHAFILTAVIEAITLVGRFGFQIESTRDSAFVASFTAGLRIHHGYLGILLGITGLILLKQGTTSNRFSYYHWMLALGIALFASDIIHHFLVLWPITGSPEFDLFYPAL